MWSNHCMFVLLKPYAMATVFKLNCLIKTNTTKQLNKTKTNK